MPCFNKIIRNSFSRTFEGILNGGVQINYWLRTLNDAVQ